MRLHGLILLAFMINSLGLIAQKDAQLLDSIVQVQFFSELDSTFDYKKVYRYDSDGREVFSSVVGFNRNSSSWITDSYKEIKYDVQGRVYETITFRAPPTGPWQIIYSYIQQKLEYDYQGNVINDFQFGRRLSSDEWTPITWTEKKTNEQGLLVERLNFMWNLESDQWEPNKQYTHSYNDSDLEILIATNIWNSDSLQWSPANRFEKSYDVAGNKIFEGEYIWNQDSLAWSLFNPSYWEYDSLGRLKKYEYPFYMEPIRGRDEYEYDSLGQITTYHYNKIYWPEYQDWKLKSKLIKAYSESGQLICSEYFLKDSANWIPYQKYEYFYNDKDLLWRRVYYLREYLTLGWKESSFWVYQYNDHDNLELIERILPDSQFVATRTHYYYSLSLLSNHLEFRADISVYPNPTNGIIHFDGGLGPYKVDIYSMKGQLMKSQDQVINSMDLSDLPNGAYSLIIRKYDKVDWKIIIKK